MMFQKIWFDCNLTVTLTNIDQYRNSSVCYVLLLGSITGDLVCHTEGIFGIVESIKKGC